MIASRVAGHLFAAFLVAGFAGGCSDALIGDSVVRTQLVSGDTDIVASSYQATERLLNGARQPMDRKRPILVASLVNGKRSFRPWNGSRQAHLPR